MTESTSGPDGLPTSGRRLSLKAQFIILLCVAMGPAAVFGFFESLAAFHRQTEKSEESLSQAAMISVLADRQVIAGARVLLETLAEQEEIRTYRTPDCTVMLQRALGRSADYDSLVISDAAGRMVCTTFEDPAPAAFGDRPWFKDAIAGNKFAVSAVVASRLRDAPAVIAAVPLHGEDDAVIGTLSAAIHVRALTAEIKDQALGEDPVTFLLDETGHVLSQGAGSSRTRELPTPDVIRDHARSDGGVFQATGLDGKPRLYAVVPVITDKLLVIAAEPLAAALPHGDFRTWGVALIPLLISLVAIGTMWIGLERLVLRWVSYLRRVGASYARGHYLAMPRRVDRAPAEFQELGRTLSQMALTARVRQRDLRAALEQKNTLVREIHHRVKNNLQIIQSLLNLQSRSAGDSNQFTALAAAKSRINALALVHQSLYEDENLEYVNLQTFLNDLCSHLLQSGWGAAKRVRVTVEAPEIITTADHAVPISLLVTEAVTNALKHAFFGRDSGTITVRLTNDPEKGAEISIHDDGIGMDTSPKPQGVRPAGIGYSLIQGFARQLRGTIKTVSDGGTTVIVTFPYLPGRQTRAP